MNFLDQAFYDLGGFVFAGIVFYVVLWILTKVGDYFR